jgi:hypothetical protein
MAENASKGGSGGGFFGRLTSFGGGNAGVRSLYRFCLLFKLFFVVSFVNVLIRNPLFSPRGCILATRKTARDGGRSLHIGTRLTALSLFLEQHL